MFGRFSRLGSRVQPRPASKPWQPLTMALLLVVVPDAWGSDPLFPFPAFDPGVSVTSLALADFNRDGRMDCVAAHFMGLRVFLGNAQGGFSTATDIGVGFVGVVAVGDLNGDGLPDIVGGNATSAVVVIMLGNGDGTFRGSPTRLTPSQPQALAIGDLNGDGRADLVTANQTTANVSVFLGIGDGTFGARSDYGTGGWPSAVSIADLNHDGRPDLVVTSEQSNSVSILLGIGAGAFGNETDFAAGQAPSAVSVSDLDRDGRLDLVVANRASNTVSILPGRGDGRFDPRHDLAAGPGPANVAVLDFNGDGRADIVVAARDGVSVMLGTAAGGVGAPVVVYRGCAAPRLAIADKNADGQPHLAIASDLISVLPGTGDGTLPVVPSFATAFGPGSIVVADFNADGRPDFASSSTSDTISVLLGDGHGAFDHRLDMVAGLDPDGLLFPGQEVLVGAADFNADGFPDLVVRADYDVELLKGDGTGGFAPWIRLSTRGFIISVDIADLNGDGRPDLAMASGRLDVFLDDADGHFTQRGVLDGFDCGGLAVADLNRDGHPDLIATSGALGFTDKLVVMLGHGDGTFGTWAVFDAGLVAVTVAAADLDGDGDMDVVVGGVERGHSGAPGMMTLVPGNGDGTFAAPTLVDHVSGSPLSIMDVDGDGRLDIVSGNRGALQVHLHQADGTFAGQLYAGPGSCMIVCTLADVNGDGRPDLLAGNDSPGLVSLCLNRSAPPPPLPLRFTLIPGTLSLSSHGRWLTGYLEPEAPHTAAEIDVASIRLNATVPVDRSAATDIADHDGDGVADLLVRFDREAVARTLTAGDDVAVTVTGSIAGHEFVGTARLRVRAGGRSAQLAGSEAAVGSLPLAIGASSADGGLHVQLSFPDRRPARLEVADVTGRLIERLEVGDLGPGAHALDIEGRGRLPCGVYFLRLTQGAERASTRVAIVR